MQPSSSHLHDAVFERTAAGQSALLAIHSSLNASERRLLAVLNGFTPLTALRALLHDEELTSSVIQKMAASGLIRAPEHQAQHFFLGWPCARA
ncbi:MAG TPA: hypothetical protein VFW93_09395 [Aquabacterium sp.]|uniref:hypothetical protein n=1 Tax=Aquabacterium sp. TaxID=1872578 RepID=UPI002E2F3A46|nr:hypothetical protein [Aquabacterium sp.]HEX5356422.1 hypothetical protein [Aquabacterium sp.]